MDDPDLDRRRDELRCKGLHDILLKHGMLVALEDLAKGLAESSAWLANIWKTGRQVPTIDQFLTFCALQRRSTPLIFSRKRKW